MGTHFGGNIVRVAYLASRYPAVSHAFIEREILALRERGVDVHTFSVRPTPPKELLTDTMRAEAARTIVLVRRDEPEVYASSHAAMLKEHPIAYARAVARASRNGELSVRGRIWQGFYHAEAVYLYRTLKERGIRHIHVHFPNVAADVARLVVAMGLEIDGPYSGWRWTMTIHGSNEFEAVSRYDLTAKIHSAAAVSCISSFTRAQVMRFSDEEHWGKLRVNRLGVDVFRYHPTDDYPVNADTSSEQSKEPLRMLCVGRLTPEKGQPLLLDALARVRHRGLDVRLTMVGSGPAEAELVRRTEDLGLDGVVEFTGSVGQDRLPDLYRAHDLFVLPSFQEGLPVVLMEAMATGIPVVTTSIAGIPELVVDGVHGRLVPAGEVDDLADAIAEIAKDPVRRVEMGQAARAQVSRLHHPDVTADAMITFLQEFHTPANLARC